VTWSLLLVHRGRIGGAGLIVAINVLVRETSLIVLPYAFVRLVRTRSLGEAARRTGAMALPAVTLLVAVHLLVRPLEPTRLSAVLEDALAFRGRHFFENQFYLFTVGTWGVLLPLVLLFPRRAVALAFKHPEEPVLVLASYASLALANNTERLLVYALPAMLPAALWSLKTFSAEAHIPWGMAALVAVVLQVLFWRETQLFGGGMSVYQPSNPVVVLAMASSFGVALALLALRRRPSAIAASPRP
jgi:hypothetical protein